MSWGEEKHRERGAYDMLGGGNEEMGRGCQSVVDN